MRQENTKDVLFSFVYFDNDWMVVRRISPDRGTVTVDPAVTITMLNTFPPRDSPFTSKIIWHQTE